MKIELNQISVRDLTQGYKNNNEEGVIGYNGLLDIRPKYQREFVYKDAQRNAVIETIIKDFPLNVMYWSKNKDNKFEVLDGQQRTISICEYVAGNFSIEINGAYKYFHNLMNDEQLKIMDYKLMVYFCEGEDSEKLEWFKTINIAGEKLTNQELLNAVYTGQWLTDAKKYFSKTGCPAYQIGSDYINGTPIRQDYLETAIKWISNDNISKYMSYNQLQPNANELRLYFENVISWVKVVFIKYRKDMKGLDWGVFYNNNKDRNFDSVKLEEEISKLMQDEDVTKKSGIYEYLLTNNKKHLNIRAFTDKQKIEAFERQKGICHMCGQDKVYKIEDMEADHIIPWHQGGKTDPDNCQMLCKIHNRTKSGI